jgi:uncharacterized NAD(P)/FAD-binding protein YdhS
VKVERRWDVLVVGGGASGTLLAVQLLRHASGPLRVALLERSGRPGPGLAYSTSSLAHLLNVPAGRMSAWPEDPEHFLRWMRRLVPETTACDFVPRLRYGQYLRAVLRTAQRHAEPGVVLELLKGEAVGLSPLEDGLQVELADGSRLDARRVVLAVGNAQPAELAVRDGGLFASPRYVRSPWSPGALEGIAPQDSVLLVGTGLTMVDTVLSLAERHHEGRIHALSRHGLLPHVHRSGAGGGAPPTARHTTPPRARSLLRALRHAAEAEPEEWRRVLDGLRPVTATLWRELPPVERRRFLRHLRAFWDVHRHRMAPAVGDTVRQLQRAGVLRVLAGRVRGFELLDESWLEARLRPRGGTADMTLRVQHVINCTGPDGAPGRAHPLLGALLDAGLARLDVLGLGLATDAGGALLDARGRAQEGLCTLGPSRRGELWESTAVPEIRAQAQALARRLLAGLAPRSPRPPTPAALPLSWPH